MALIRSYSQIEKMRRAGELTPAEKELLQKCQGGEQVVLGDGTRPDRATPERTIRADLLRYLILGGCEQFRTHERGVLVNGAWVEDKLDLALAAARGATLLRDCVFPDEIDTTQARFQWLDLEGSRLKGLWASGCQVTGNLRLDRVETSGPVLLVGATIGSQLSCENAKLDGGSGKALNAQDAQITGGALLNGLTSKGEVSFSGATIGGPHAWASAKLDGGSGRALNAQDAQIAGNVFLNGLTAKGEVRLAGVVIGGQLNCQGVALDGGDGDALNGQRMRVEAGFLWRDLAEVTGKVYLVSAYVSDLVDDDASWEKTDALRLTGLTYDNLLGPLDLDMRLAWLRKGAKSNGAFHPQPYQQLAKVLRASGHRAEARAVLIEKEREQRRAAKAAALENISSAPKRMLVHLCYLPHRFWSWLIGWSTGYGYAPWRIAWPLLILIACQSELARITWHLGDFAPNSDVVLVSDGWTRIANAPGGLDINAAEKWSDPAGPGRDYETFNALFYAVDVVLPLVDLGQEAAWAPSPVRGPLGEFAHGAQKVFVLLGWVVAAIFAGAVTGIIRHDD